MGQFTAVSPARHVRNLSVSDKHHNMLGINEFLLLSSSASFSRLSSSSSVSSFSSTLYALDVYMYANVLDTTINRCNKAQLWTKSALMMCSSYQLDPTSMIYPRRRCVRGILRLAYQHSRKQTLKPTDRAIHDEFLQAHVYSLIQPYNPIAQAQVRALD